jgi:hypothetical protein
MASLPPNDRPERRKIRIKMPITEHEFSEVSNLKPVKIIADLMELGIFGTMTLKLTESSLVIVGQKNGLDVEIVPPPQT